MTEKRIGGNQVPHVIDIALVEVLLAGELEHRGLETCVADHDRRAEGSRLVELRLVVQCQLLLLFVMAEDHGPVLRPDVDTLAIDGGGVVCFPEDFEQFRVGNLG